MATRKSRKTASAAKIRVHTDDYGRKVYTVVGTKKFAYTLAKAKEIASKSKKRKSTKASSSSTAMTVRTRKPAKRTTAKRGASYRRRGKADARFKGFDGLEMDEPMTAAERRAVVARAKASNRKRTRKGGAKRNAKGQFVKRGSKKTAVRRNTESRASYLAKRRTTLVQENAMYDVYSNLYTEGMVSRKTGRPVAPRMGRSVGEAEGKDAAIRIAEDYIDDQGVRGLLYREDIGNTVVYRGKKGSGLGGMIEIYPMDDREILKEEAVFQAQRSARQRAASGRKTATRSNRRR